DLARGAPAQDAKPAAAPAALRQDLDLERRAEGAAHAPGRSDRLHAPAAPPRSRRVRRQVAAVRVVVAPGREEDEEALADDAAAPVDLEMRHRLRREPVLPHAVAPGPEVDVDGPALARDADRAAPAVGRGRPH